MKIEISEIVTVGGNLFTYLLTTIQSNEILQYIEFGLSVSISIMILVYRIWKWWREAKKDGRIDDDELGQLGEILEDAKKDIDKEDKSK